MHAGKHEGVATNYVKIAVKLKAEILLLRNSALPLLLSKMQLPQLLDLILDKFIIQYNSYVICMQQ